MKRQAREIGRPGDRLRHFAFRIFSELRYNKPMKPWSAIMVRILVAGALLFAPLAPMAANCAPAAETPSTEMHGKSPEAKSTAGAIGHDCCDLSDQADRDSDAGQPMCMSGCIAIAGLPLPAQSGLVQLAPATEPSVAILPAIDWLPPPLYDPPILRS
jgi:hypothetical protein